MQLSTTTFSAFLATTLAVVAGVYALNTIVDPAGLRSVDAVETLARTQRADQYLVGPVAFDQRAWVRGKLAVAEQCDIVVLGSSTLGMLDTTMATAPVLNTWLTGPTIEDLEAEVVLLEHAKCRPAQIVLGIDPWFVNPLVEDQRWRTLASEQREFRGTGIVARVRERVQTVWETLRERLNVATTERSISTLRTAPLRPPHLVTAWETECPQLSANAALRAGDGHFVRCPQIALAPYAVARLAATYMDRDFHRMRSWRVVDRGRLARLDVVVRRLARIAPVAIVTPPYHPAAFATLPQPLLAELDRALADLAIATRTTFHPLRDPATLGCTEFADSHHMLPACARRLAARVLP